MQLALREAELAREENEVPVGCVIVRAGEVIARGHNLREQRQNALLHAEMVAIDAACRALGTWRLDDCALYVTLEPCPMCAGAILNARIGRIVYGAGDENMGACGGVLNLFEEAYGFRPQIRGGVLRERCAALLRDFFRNMRAENNG